MSDERTIKPNSPADFTPQLGDYKTLQPFRYWCQKVLPLVYDDSLSYYELLCKVVDYLNKTMEDVETLHGDVTSLRSAYEELQSYVNNYFATLDVQEEINNKLDSMAKDGTLTNLIRAYIDPLINEQNNKITVLENRMNTFASLPEGSTSGNAELIDIRVPASGFNNGKTYLTAGEAVRGQAISLKDYIEYFKDDVSKAFNVSENIYSPHLFANTKGISLTIADGTEFTDSTTTNAITTGYFDTHEGDVWRFYRWNTAKTNIFPMEIRVFWFDENKKYISGATINGDVTAPIRSRYLRFTEKFTLLYPELDVMVTKNFPFGVNDYEPYGFKQLKESFLPKETYELLQKSGTLHNGDSWVLENNNIMARKVFVLSGNVNTFSTLEMGHGTKINTSSSWVVVDNENITVHSTPTNKVTLPHGLTITNTFQLIIEVGANYKAKITIVSNGKKYNTEQDWDGNIGNIFVNSINSVLEDCTVSWTCKNYSSPIWAYGDSYFGMANNSRWVTQLLRNGYGTNMLIDGYPGRGSNDAYTSLQASLKHGKPKYILWAMGMNDPDNDSSVNKTWNNIFYNVKNICEENGITLIGCTIPNTPTVFNSYKNNVVRNAGIKYVDFAKSVGAENKGAAWYDGMLSDDKVHPTEKGAITLYLQALADFPELMNT